MEDYAPFFSPDGKKIAYSRTTYRGAALPTSAIYTVNVGRGGESKVTDGEGPSYSPDGKRIAYSGLAGLERNNAESDIHTINVGGGGKATLTNSNNVSESYPSWSRP